MTRINRVINIFYSSTNDLGSFDRKKLFDKICKRVETGKSVKINTIYWKENIPGGIGLTSGQDVIDQFVSNKYDIYFGILGARYGSGTVSEYKKAIDNHIRTASPPYLYFGFDETPINPFTISSSFEEVVNFRTDISTNVKYGRAMLYFVFSGSEDFQSKVFQNLCAAIDGLEECVLGGAIIK